MTIRSECPCSEIPFVKMLYNRRFKDTIHWSLFELLEEARFVIRCNSMDAEVSCC